jgi:hypothetical protein
MLLIYIKEERAPIDFLVAHSHKLMSSAVFHKNMVNIGTVIPATAICYNGRNSIQLKTNTTNKSKK